MAKQQANPDDKFEVHHKEENGQHYLTFIPAIKNDGYPPQTIHVAQAQWEALKYHFAVGTSNTGIEKIVYIH